MTFTMVQTAKSSEHFWGFILLIRVNMQWSKSFFHFIINDRFEKKQTLSYSEVYSELSNFENDAEPGFTALYGFPT